MRLLVHEVAQIAGVVPFTVRKYIRSGRLSATKVGGVWTIDERDLLALAAHPPRTGRPPRDRGAGRPAPDTRARKVTVAELQQIVAEVAGDDPTIRTSVRPTPAATSFRAVVAKWIGRHRDEVADA